ncbi:signal peptidase I [Nocardioides halotolerans]|uniref:signal peptidase I n=1 Tax=Nocardioides halotolerans TaxID=433660 RepID=UPI0004217762|nr:signal peptidase I [Nocardioides halotolerans]
MSEPTRARTIALAAVRWTARAALVSVLMIVIAAIAVVVVLPRATNGAALTVLTGSMTPEIPVGSIVLVRPVDPGTLEIGDVATYQSEPGEDVYITHRITKIQQTDKGLAFTFKGDANRGADMDKVPAAAIRGQVWFHVPYLGSIRDGLHGKGGISLVGMILLAGYALTQLSGSLRDRRKKDDEPAVEDEPTPSLTIDRALILATLARPEGEAPADLVRRWSGLLLRSDEATYTLLIAPPEGGVEAALELLRLQEPLSIEVWDAPTSVVGSRTEVPLSEDAQVAGASD